MLQPFADSILRKMETNTMACWLFKQEPDAYSYADLVRDGSTTWDGVGNAVALKHLRQVQVGDAIWFYHTGKQKAIVGEMRATAIDGGIVRVEPVRPLAKSVTLAMVKADDTLATWELVRLPRLSVMPVSDAQWLRIRELAGEMLPE